ncbi:MAG: NADH-quinone oxidoreductase subunit M [Anaerolineales bacterium]|nr:NADH-quinone oxidoreductase subunit M [Anaerolineales bacterium]
MSIPFLALPLVLAGIMPLLGKISKRFLPDLVANLTLLFLLGYGIFCARELVLTGPNLLQAALPDMTLNITLTLDSFNILLLLTVALVGLGVTLYSIDYMEHYDGKAIFYALLLIMIAGMNGLILADDLFTMYIFLEAAAIASYGLIAFGRKREELEASLKYLMLSAVATAFLLLSIAVLFGLTGSLKLSAVAAGLAALDAQGAAALCAALFLMAFGLKAALVPFHAWLPDAHSSAPAPISAMLSGVLIKVLGVYTLIRVVLTVFGLSSAIENILMILGIVSILTGAFLALGQNDVKRMLAYSSISQVGYIVLGIGIGTPLGILGGLFHLLNHASAKGLLFLNAGALEHATGTRELDKLGGLGKRMPITAGTSVIGSLAIAGVPPLNGFWSKLIILLALIQAKLYAGALIAALAGILTLWYYLVLQRRAFFGKLNEAWQNVREAPFWMSASSILLGAVCVLVGLGFPFVIQNWIQPAADALTAGQSVLHLPGF